MLDSIEKQVHDWLKLLKLPHMPAILKHWIVDNLWWVITLLAVLGNVSVLFGIIHHWSTYGSLFGVTSSWPESESGLNIILTFIGATLMGYAVKPLREKVLQGWKLLFGTLLVEIAMTIVGLITAVLNVSFIGLVYTVVFNGAFLVAYAYMLFEIKGGYIQRIRTKAAAKHTK